MSLQLHETNFCWAFDKPSWQRIWSNGTVLYRSKRLRVQKPLRRSWSQRLYAPALTAELQQMPLSVLIYLWSILTLSSRTYSLPFSFFGLGAKFFGPKWFKMPLQGFAEVVTKRKDHFVFCNFEKCCLYTELVTVFHEVHLCWSRMVTEIVIDLKIHVVFLNLGIKASVYFSINVHSIKYEGFEEHTHRQSKCIQGILYVRMKQISSFVLIATEEACHLL